jgi:hypothetical protein
MQKLPVEFKTQWLESLRSGEYKQGKDALKTVTADGTFYCCLGVASVFCGGDNDEQYKNQVLMGDTVPAAIRGEAWNNPTVARLTSMNDSGKSFNEIADWIEKNL